MTVSDTAGMIRAIDSMTVDQCREICWCQSDNRTPAWAMRWAPNYPTLRFLPEGEAA